MTTTISAPERHLSDVVVATAKPVMPAVVRFRYVWIALVLALAIRLELHDYDWDGVMVLGAHSIFGSDGLHAYAHQPAMQAGPPAFVVVEVLTQVFGSHAMLVVHALLGLVFLYALWEVERTVKLFPEPVRAVSWWRPSTVVPPSALLLGFALLPIWNYWAEPHQVSRARDLLVWVPLVACSLQLGLRRIGRDQVLSTPAVETQVLLLGLFVAPYWGILAGAWGHIDDGLTIAATVFAMSRIARNNPWMSGLAAGIAIAIKPWAIFTIPMLWRLERGRLRALALAVAIPILCWAPFLLAAPKTLSAGGRQFKLYPGSPVAVFGLEGPNAPTWLRSVQILGILVAATIVVRWGSWHQAPAAAIMARLLLDNATFVYYSVGALFVVALCDLVARRVPWRTVMLAGGLWFAQFFTGGHNPFWIRSAVLLTALVSYLIPPSVFAYAARFLWVPQVAQRQLGQTHPQDALL